MKGKIRKTDPVFIKSVDFYLSMDLFELRLNF